MDDSEYEYKTLSVKIQKVFCFLDHEHVKFLKNAKNLGEYNTFVK